MKIKTARAWEIAANTATVIAMLLIIGASITVLVTDTNSYSNMLLPIAIILALPVLVVDCAKSFSKFVARRFSRTRVQCGE